MAEKKHGAGAVDADSFRRMDAGAVTESGRVRIRINVATISHFKVANHSHGFPATLSHHKVATPSHFKIATRLH